MLELAKKYEGTGVFEDMDDLQSHFYPHDVLDVEHDCVVVLFEGVNQQVTYEWWTDRLQLWAGEEQRLKLIK